MTQTRYITGVTTLEELKREYKRLALLHHPDIGGDTEKGRAERGHNMTYREWAKLTHEQQKAYYMAYIKRLTAYTANR